jgi:hypothetical protein
MATSLYDLSVSSYLQTLGAVERFLALGLRHFEQTNIDPEKIVETRVHPDMLPFRFQIQSVVHHSVGAIEALRNGTFRPPDRGARPDFRGLQSLVGGAQETLRQLSPDEINAHESSEVKFQAGEYELRFAAPEFVLSFSLPNLHFHATTAYDILRGEGVPLGKRDYMGRLRLKR